MQIKLLYHGCFCSNDVHFWTAEASKSEGGKKPSLAVFMSFVGMNFYKLLRPARRKRERERILDVHSQMGMPDPSLAV